MESRIIFAQTYCGFVKFCTMFSAAAAPAFSVILLPGKQNTAGCRGQFPTAETALNPRPIPVCRAGSARTQFGTGWPAASKRPLGPPTAT